MQIHFLYGTQSGTAEYLCDKLKDKVGDRFDCKVSSMDEVDPTALDPETFYVLVSATFGSGELPDSAQSFFETLEERKPDLSRIRFAIFGLGDRTFGETFANGSKILMTQMLACNAQMVGERGLHDASSDDLPQHVAVPWLMDVLSQFSA
ncbi:flavodoxin domain-containing protein [Hyphomicrobium sp.]|uniref:flavodoxin domain-containing protein n=1 Tax=Hyphomicrobium sp. TaxID=82 RepID=UPI0025BE7E18|nr:flavodoxin domain-containing protein [Hyphomicrobium sp.]MCC7252149.1 flavodoxin domain-containing protein [Hyphomicrobium sp.]